MDSLHQIFFSQRNRDSLLNLAFHVFHVPFDLIDQTANCSLTACPKLLSIAEQAINLLTFSQLSSLLESAQGGGKLKQSLEICSRLAI